MSATGANHATHAHLRCTLEECLGNDGIGLRDSFASTCDSEDAVVDTLNNLADTGFHTGLVAQVGDILAAFAYDHTSFLGGNDGT